MITLDKSYLIAKGSERECYICPFDENKIIKIIYRKKGINNQNKLEFKYYEYLKKKDVSFSNITKCYGWLETNLGAGLLFERVLNFDNSEPLTLRENFIRRTLTLRSEKKLLNELKDYLEKESIIFIDATTVNVVVKKVTDKESKLIIIDGLGSKREGIKFYLYQIFPFYRNYKIKKQWSVFLSNIERVKNKIDLNQQL